MAGEDVPTSFPILFILEAILSARGQPDQKEPVPNNTTCYCYATCHLLPSFDCLQLWSIWCLFLYVQICTWSQNQSQCSVPSCCGGFPSTWLPWAHVSQAAWSVLYKFAHAPHDCRKHVSLIGSWGMRLSHVYAHAYYKEQAHQLHWSDEQRLAAKPCLLNVYIVHLHHRTTSTTMTPHYA